jgi:ribosomal-protein-serine acetyltransferase
MKHILNSDLYLKLIELADSKALFHLVDSNRQYLKQWLPWLDYNQKEQDTIDFINKNIQDKNIVMGIFYQNELVGLCSNHPIDHANRKVAIGYWISEHVGGKGIMSKVVRYFCDYLFKTTDLNRIEIRVATGNVASQKIAEKCGFTFGEIIHNAENLYGKFVDHKVYSLAKPSSSNSTKT